MVKRREGIKTKEMRFQLSESLANEIYIILLDPMTLRPAYGSLSVVAEKLFADWVRDVKENGLPQYLID